MKFGVRCTAWFVGSLVLLLGHIATAAAQPLISEFEPNPVGSDPATQLVELSGIPGASFSGAVVSVECDVSILIIDRATPVTGSFDASGLLTVSIPDLENPSFILLLVNGAAPPIGVSPAGLLDASNVVDAIGIPDSVIDVARCSPAAIDPSLAAVGDSFTYTGDEPKLVFRNASTGSWYALNDPDRGEVIDIDANSLDPDIFISGNALLPSFGEINPSTEDSRVRISEFEPNPFGSDPAEQLVELSGSPGAFFAGAIVSVDCDTTNLTIDRSTAVTGVFDANGLLTVPIADLENPSFILLLVNGPAPPTAVSPQGLLDSSNVVDAIGIPDISLDEARCSPTAIDPSLAAVGESFAYTGDEPKLVFRNASRGSWYAINDPPGGVVVDIDANGLDPAIFLTGDPFLTSFGDINPSTTVIAGPTYTSRRIHEIQGSGATVTNPGELVEVQAVVTGLLERVDAGTTSVEGFFIQEEDADADGDPATSEGIYVFCLNNCPSLAEGDLVTVQGMAVDFQGMSQIDATAGTIAINANTALPAAAAIFLPAAGRTDAESTFESFEGMRVTFPQDLFVSEYFQLARYGQVILFEGGRPRQFTDASPPSVTGYQQHLESIAKRRIILDDLNNAQNANDPVFHPQPNGFSTGEFFRGGDAVNNLTGVLHWSWAGSSGTDAWRVRPTQTTPAAFTPLNPRSAAPDDVGGSLRVATLNLLNYFNTIDDSINACGPNLVSCRGADSAAERLRQLSKLTAALREIDADIVGLVELENDSTDATVASIAAELTDYAYVATGFIGGDAIKVGIIYKPSTVAPVGSFAILDSSVDPAFNDSKNRPTLVQTFEENASGERLTVAVNHFKSKGSPCDDVGDPGVADGQGNCNGTREAAATALATYLATDPTGSGDPDFVILGDLNAYAMEDPIKALENAGYDNLIGQLLGPDAYSFLFDGQLGYLDYALTTSSLTAQVTGVTAWHINADESSLFDYNDTVQDPSEPLFAVKPSTNILYSADAYRSSDHDPIVVGLELSSDSDGDGVLDAQDNCITFANPTQLDSNGDGFGNACDADLNDDGIVNALDLGLFKKVFFSADADADFNGDGAVNALDLGRMKQLFFNPPGPSGTAP